MFGNRRWGWRICKAETDWQGNKTSYFKCGREVTSCKEPEMASRPVTANFRIRARHVKQKVACSRIFWLNEAEWFGSGAPFYIFECTDINGLECYLFHTRGCSNHCQHVISVSRRFILRGTHSAGLRQCNRCKGHGKWSRKGWWGLK